MSTIITKDFINKHKTAKGGWTKKQLDVLGVKWPPEKGWVNALIGKEITFQQTIRFIKGKY